MTDSRCLVMTPRGTHTRERDWDGKPEAIVQMMEEMNLLVTGNKREELYDDPVHRIHLLKFLNERCFPYVFCKHPSTNACITTCINIYWKMIRKSGDDSDVRTCHFFQNGNGRTCLMFMIWMLGAKNIYLREDNRSFATLMNTLVGPPGAREGMGVQPVSCDAAQINGQKLFVEGGPDGIDDMTKGEYLDSIFLLLKKGQ